MRVLGIDPGLTRCGWGVVDGRPGARPTAIGVGVLRTSAELDLELRLLELHTEITGLLRLHRPDVIATERVFTQNNKGTYALSELPMPKDYPEWPSGQQVQAYLESYVEKFDLARMLHLDTEVTSAVPVTAGGWLSA